MSAGEGVRRIGLSLAVLYWCGAGVIAAAVGANAAIEKNTLTVAVDGQNYEVAAYDAQEAQTYATAQRQKESADCAQSQRGLPGFQLNCFHSTYVEVPNRYDMASKATAFMKALGVCAILFIPLWVLASLLGWIFRGFATA